jgi:Flp pilus assembly protein TadG
MKTWSKRIHNEDAQVIALFAMLAFVIIGLMGLASDIGRIYVARAELGRSVDSAALAGAKQLPDITAADAKARAYISENEPYADVVVEVYPDVPSQQVEVRATKTVNTIFLRALGVGTVEVQNSATAGFGTVPVDTVMAIDATGSMGASPCNSNDNNSGCPIWEAKQAAIGFTNTLLPATNTVVGNISFRGCYDPPNNDTGCVNTSTLGSLTGTASTLITKINQMSALGGTGTNVCLGLDKAAEVLFGTGSHTASNTISNIVILTDGDNTYNNNAYQSSPASPVAACQPTTSPSNSDTFLGTGCSASGQGSPSGSNPGSNSETRERQLDTATKNRADQLKALGVQIYVIGFGVCGTPDGQISSSAYCSVIGNNNPDTYMDQRVAKCIASNSPGTNDHYWNVTTATELPGVFQEIAQQIAFRLIK